MNPRIRFFVAIAIWALLLPEFLAGAIHDNDGVLNTKTPEFNSADRNSQSSNSSFKDGAFEAVHFTADEIRVFNKDNAARFMAESEPALADDIGEFLLDFFHDSQAQLVLDLDLFREVYRELKLNNVKHAALDSDVDRLQAINISFLPYK